jgi:uncharacterized membrane protein
MKKFEPTNNPHLEKRDEIGVVKTADVIESFNEKVALKLTKVIGSMKMFWAMAAMMTLWMAGIGELLFNDPYPFSLMLLIFAGVFQALAMVAIMVGQNILSKAADARSDMMYHDTEAILAEVKDLHEHLHHQDETIQELRKKLI